MEGLCAKVDRLQAEFNRLSIDAPEYREKLIELELHKMELIVTDAIDNLDTYDAIKALLGRDMLRSTVDDGYDDDEWNEVDERMKNHIIGTIVEKTLRLV